MKMNAGILGALFGLAGLASAHMEMKNPPPFRSKFNDFTTDVDYSMTSPLNAGGSDFPCKGYQSLMGTPQGQSVINYQPGQTYTFTITGGTPHNGGSCQASLSYDSGKTWTVIHSYIGNCPISAGDTNYDFTVPNDTPAGEALFGWSWFNQVGNREMYMNCAVVTIGGGKKRADVDARAPGDAFTSRPAMFVANVGNGCGTAEGKDLEFPNPGPDVTRKTPKDQTAPPTGTCAEGAKAPEPEPQPEPSQEPVQTTSAEPQPTKTMSVSPTPFSSSPSVSPTMPSLPLSPSASKNISSPTSSPGGVFITVPASDKPTTLATSVRTADPAPTNDNAGGNDDGQSDVGLMEIGSACDREGEWNCIDGGASYQRCASGIWSDRMAPYAGTVCKVGKSDSLIIARARSPAPNYGQVLRASRIAAREARA
ncbi:uncharacterized protein F5Z01DRAFT_392097 [Emericellopsis atlantica]|uniref:Extracellular protein n=1 Tax=Emericellopsis atlantica TaxID=2614577 RepID=A0A9P8CS69_9HYPO|nr:uncharacterized protein F5Z01DRAFT_392097 [Emericellopsis atlantica]KAG9257488.1 hypothetical protein F5Z01DRAFT_392097 [Emericellopsis atlantica]